MHPRVRRVVTLLGVYPPSILAKEIPTLVAGRWSSVSCADAVLPEFGDHCWTDRLGVRVVLR
jgi:hypothetical protein